MTGFDSKRNAAKAKLNDDDDTQVYADTLTVVYQRGFADGKKAANAMHELARLGQEIEQEPCVGKDPRCPCQDGDACHYKDCGGTKARPVPQAEPTPWRDMVVVTLVREGIDKHKARELADHFAAQRPWQGLTDEEKKKIATIAGCTEDDDGHIVTEIFRLAEIKLKERNNGH
jgi:hypothetical protein